MTLPSGWNREYEGRHGAEFFYEPRNLTVSVLPRYERAFGRASEKDPVGFVVRVHQLLSPGPSVPMTLGECETFASASDLARTYMARVDARRVRSSNDGAFAAFTDVAAYDDDVLVALCGSLSGSSVRSLVHYDDGAVAVPYATDESPAAVRKRLTGRVRALAALTDDEESACYVSRDAGDLAWVSRDDGDGTLVEFADAHDDVAAFLEELAQFVRRKDADAAADADADSGAGAGATDDA
jgi:hypothetical protein